MLDGFGVAPDNVDLSLYFPDFASPLARSPADPYDDFRVLNYAHYGGQLDSRVQFHADRPDRDYTELEDKTANTIIFNDDSADAEKVLLGFDADEANEINIRGSIDTAAVSGSFSLSGEDDGSILLANETGLESGENRSASAFIGDFPFGGTRGDSDFYAVRDVKRGDVISIVLDAVDVGTPLLPTGSPLNAAVVIYNSLGEVVSLQDNNIVQINGIVGAISADPELSYVAEESDDYFVAVVGAIAQGFFLPENPFESDSLVIPLSTGPYDITIGLNAVDVDYYEFELNAGDVFGAASRGIVNNIELVGANGRTIVGNPNPLFPNALYPAESPLPSVGRSIISYVVPEAGTYFLRATTASGVAGEANYQIQTEVHRPALESEPHGTKQILFLDFDGEELNTAPLFSPFPGPVTLSPMRSFMANWGLRTRDENALIDGIVKAVEEDFRDIARRGNNGSFDQSGRGGEFGIEILNSRDHADPFGQPNVSRVIVGGTVTESNISTIGIAQSLDVGNFDTEETGIVLLDIISGPAYVVGFIDLDGDGQPDDVDGDGEPDLFNFPNEDSANHYLTRGTKDKIDLVAEIVGNTISHEAGHYFGGLHTDPFSEHPNIMDSGGNSPDFYGFGPDRIFGTQDDVDVDFGKDEYDPVEEHIGIEDTLNVIAFGLSTGKGAANGGGSGGSGATATGVVYLDRNENGRVGENERRLDDYIVYVDSDKNGRFDIGEPADRTDLRGRYHLSNVSAGDRIRVQVGPGFVPVSPSSAEHRIGANTSLRGLNFGLNVGQGSGEGFDYGDAPSPYPSAGVRHGIVDGFSLGATVDGESGPQGDDGDDGVEFVTDVFPSGRATIRVEISNGDQSPGRLHGWIDFDGDGTWSTPGEKIIHNVGVHEGVNTLSFDVPSWAVESPTQARFRYGYEQDLSFTGAAIAGEVEDYTVNIERTGPSAVDDSFEFRRNVGPQTLSVLANDSVRSGSLRIESVSNPSSGGTVRIGSGGSTLVYTAMPDFSGTETFTYTVTDANGLTDTADVTVVVTPDFVSIRLVATNSAGQPITRAEVGSEFLLQAFVQDLRSEDPTGVHSAYLDVMYAFNLATALGPVTYGAMYPNDKSGFLDPGLFDEIGAFAEGVSRVGPDELLLFSVPMRAEQVGTVEFVGSPADLSPAHDILLFDDDLPVPTNRVAYGSYELTITETGVPATATNPLNALDVNDDRSVSPIDVLLVINDLNGHAAAKPVGVNHYLDVSGDGEISPIDALLVINFLNRDLALAAVAAAIEETDSPNVETMVTELTGSGITHEDRENTRDHHVVQESLFELDRTPETLRADAIASILDEMDEEDQLL